MAKLISRNGQWVVVPRAKTPRPTPDYFLERMAAEEALYLDRLAYEAWLLTVAADLPLPEPTEEN